MTFQQYSEEGRESFELHRAEGRSRKNRNFHQNPQKNQKTLCTMQNDGTQLLLCPIFGEIGQTSKEE